MPAAAYSSGLSSRSVARVEGETTSATMATSAAAYTRVSPARLVTTTSGMRMRDGATRTLTASTTSQPSGDATSSALASRRATCWCSLLGAGVTRRLPSSSSCRWPSSGSARNSSSVQGPGWSNAAARILVHLRSRRSSTPPVWHSPPALTSAATQLWTTRPGRARARDPWLGSAAAVARRQRGLGLGRGGRRAGAEGGQEGDGQQRADQQGAAGQQVAGMEAGDERLADDAAGGGRGGRGRARAGAGGRRGGRARAPGRGARGGRRGRVRELGITFLTS